MCSNRHFVFPPWGNIWGGGLICIFHSQCKKERIGALHVRTSFAATGTSILPMTCALTIRKETQYNSRTQPFVRICVFPDIVDLTSKIFPMVGKTKWPVCAISFSISKQFHHRRERALYYIDCFMFCLFVLFVSVLSSTFCCKLCKKCR